MRYLSLLLLIPALAYPQGLNQNKAGVTGGGKVLAAFPLTTSGALIEEDANTVAHVYWNGTALVDTKGNAWTQNGTVPQVTANPFTTTRYGAGPFSTSNYYRLGTGADVLDFPGDFTICTVFVDNGVTTPQELVINGEYGASGAGWNLWRYLGDVIYLDTYGPSDTYTRTASTATVKGTVNVVCAGRSGSTQYVKVNGTATVSTGGSKTGAPSAFPAYIGKDYATGNALGGTIYEIYATSTPFTEATVTAIQQKVLGHFDGYSPLSVTRATNATYAPRSATPYDLYTAAPGVARITDGGLLVEPARTNYALRSSMSSGTAWTAPWVSGTVSVATVAGGVGGGTWAEATSSNDAASFYSAITVPSNTTFVASGWVSKASGSSAASIGVDCTGAAAPTSCACVRSDGGACTPTIAFTSMCFAVATVGTTPVRLSSITTCAAAKTVVNWYGLSGDTVTRAGIVTRFSAPQLEVGTYPTSFIGPVAGTAVARNADQVSATVPASLSVGSKWCLAVTAQPEEGRAWVQPVVDAATWSIGALNAAGNVRLTTYLDGKGYLSTVDASAGQSYNGFTPSLTAGTGYRLTSCFGPNGATPAQYVDGTARALTKSGPGTGVLSAFGTGLYFGGTTTGGTEFGGFLKNLRICDAKNAKECK